MRAGIGFVLALLSSPGGACASGGSTLERSAAAVPTAAPCVSTPEEQGMDSSVLQRAFRDIQREGKALHSLVVVRNGCLVVEAYWPPYHREQKHYLNSATKAFLSALVGIAVHEEKLREDDLVSSYFPEYVSADGDPRRKRITVKHLLTMSSGISWPQSARENASDQMGRSSDWVRFILDRPMAAEPGTVTNYSNGDSHLLSAILQKATGITALEFARKRLFEPLQIRDVAWDSDPQGRSIGSAALQMRPVDMAKLGSLYFGYGESGTNRILDREWVERALTGHVKMPARGGAAGYGYYWWLYPERKLFEAWGGAGQRIGVFRDLGLVVVMTADIPDDIPRSPFAARLYDAVRESVKVVSARPRTRRASPGTPRSPRGSPPAGRG
ncbi:MAG: serine hydrolase [Deltaproteobacteria bacterium]|nr:MAG: serine hydrolase [Deltaproteobacteria bacterium]